ncbi:hypothetical protein SLEP1_g9024 [Rubroshorea leprosula]|uniref:Chlororespiratory reduction 4 n=1 Tax=Rubroshorea leprosula TaxID=152421 RepID=A0AAV5IEL1_9ROSI|nr:hypothetical protein SLEP1_g9024 [Rubroshorea leprosula]
MAAKLRVPRPTSTRLSSLSLDKSLKSLKNLSKPPPKLWPGDPQPQTAAFEYQELPVLDLNHPILCTLESCTSFREFNQIQSRLIVSGLFEHSLVASRVIKKLCTSLNSVSRAVFMFDCIKEPDAFICNTVLKGLLNLNDPAGALSFYYEKMVARLVEQNHFTFPLLGKVCAEIGSLREGEKVHARVLKLGFQSDLFIKNSLIHMYPVCGDMGAARQVFDSGFVLDLVSWNSIIDGYVKNGEIGIARELFDEMTERDIYSWNSMLAGYVGIGDMEAAWELFDRMPSRDVVSWNCMVDGYARTGNASMAQECFDLMPKRNVVSWNTMLALYARCKNYASCLTLFDMMIAGGEVRPNNASLVSVLTACANLGRLDRGQWIHSYIKGSRIECDMLLSTALLTMYGKCGAMDLARNVFNEMPEKNVVSWNSMIMGYGTHGYGEKALELFLDMAKGGPMPNDATFVCVLSACSRDGKVLEGWWCFNLMCQVYKIEPKVEHCGCMFDLLGQVGLVKHLDELKKTMHEEGPIIWRALLSACKAHSLLELGEVVAKWLMELEPIDIAPYVLLSYVYAMEERWDDLENVRKMVKERGLLRTLWPIHSHSGESGSKFFLENTSASRRTVMYSMLKEMDVKLKTSSIDFVEVSEL